MLSEPGLVEHAGNPSTWKTKDKTATNWKLAWDSEQVPDEPYLHLNN